MPTSSLTGEGLKRYQRWLAVQRAKGVEPSDAATQNFLQGEIQANIASDTDRQQTSLARESLAIQNKAVDANISAANERLSLLNKQIDRQSGADTISGITEAIKGVGALNQLTGGALAQGVGSGIRSAYDYLTRDGGDVAASLYDTGAEMLAGVDDIYDVGSEVYDVGSEIFAGFEDVATEVWDDVYDISGLLF